MILDWIAGALGSAAAVVTLPGSIELAFLTFSALLPRPKVVRARENKRFKLAVVIPAYNEEHQISSTITSVLTADNSGIELATIVIADNCTDQTACRAVAAGARAIERNDQLRRGKGYALDYAFQILLREGYEGFLVVDADTHIAPNTLCEVVANFRAGADAVQCRYLVRNPGDSLRTRLMCVALMAFNVLRLRGRDRWGLSVGINGNGFGLRADTLRKVPFGAVSVVEDLEYHLDLVRAGLHVRFANDAAVYGDMPALGKGVKTQRKRWEGGRFRMLVERAPSLAREVLNGRWALLEPLGELTLLPLAFHTILLTLAAAIPFWPSRIFGLAGLTFVFIHLIVAIIVGGGGWPEIRALIAAPFYMGWKLMLLPALIGSARSKTAWVRTERTGKEPE